MAIVVFDMGRRVETPASPTQFKLNKIAATKAVHNDAIADADQRRHEQQLQQYREQTLPQAVAQVRDIMSTPVKSVRQSESVRHVWETLQHTGLHHLPVVDDEMHVLAIIADRDIMRQLLSKANIWQHDVVRYASHPVICIRDHADIRQAADSLYRYRIGALPVVDEHNRLVGILTRSDILRTLSHYGPLELWA